MAAFTWPPSLPQRPQMDSFSEDEGVIMVRTPMDQGPAKLRRRSARPSQMQVSFYMTPAQKTTLDNFILNTLRGTARFDFTHPLTNLVREVRIVPQSDGQLYRASLITFNWYNISMMFEVLP